MALKFTTSDPDKLLSAFKKAVDDGRVATWSYDKDGDFTHTSEQWKFSAWMRPEKLNGSLTFYILKPKNRNISTEIYAIYHGRFLESMLVHCDSLFDEAEATAMASGDDLVK